MGERFRSLAGRFLKILYRAALPCLIIYTILLISFLVQGTPHDAVLAPKVYLSLLMVCYLTAFITTLVLELGELRQAFRRRDGALLGNTFGGFRKQDKLFCDALTFFSEGAVRHALELLLDLQDPQKYTLTDAEAAAAAFYTGRCYQRLGCPSNAVSFYHTAGEKGFSRPYALLYEARSCSESGRYDEAFDLFQSLLRNDPPKDFYFLYTDIGFLFLRQRKLDEAEHWFRKSVDTGQNYAFALSGLSIVALQRGDFHTAYDYRYRALVNRLSDPKSFREYFSENRQLILDEHPEWAERAEAEENAFRTEKAQTQAAQAIAGTAADTSAKPENTPSHSDHPES